MAQSVFQVLRYTHAGELTNDSDLSDNLVGLFAV